jgi:DNA-binding response OmpR family regulator
VPPETVLAVTTDRVLGRALTAALHDRGHVVAVTDGARRALEVLDEVLPDALVLDLSMTNGWELCHRLIAAHPLMSVVLVASVSRCTEARNRFQNSRVRVVSASTVPYLLAGRVERALLQGSTSAIEVADVKVDRLSRRAWVNEIEVHLRVKEFDLLTTLVANAGRALSREQIMSDVWHDTWTGTTKTLDVHIATLRRRIGEPPGTASRITTLRGVGYRFEADPDFRQRPGM